LIFGNNQQLNNDPRLFADDAVSQLQNKNAPEIFDRMKELWGLAKAEGSTVLVIPTLPTNVG
jgi:ABC-type lipoprotein export system ATPase subunit